MRKSQRVPVIRMLFVALFMSLFFVGTADAQKDVSAYVGKFTLAYPVHWGKSVLQPGDYTITIGSTGTPILALIRNGEGAPVARVMSGSRSESTHGQNALLIKDKDGQPTVHSLALADLGMVLVYDPTLAQERIQEARASRTVPVMWAKK